MEYLIIFWLSHTISSNTLRVEYWKLHAWIKLPLPNMKFLFMHPQCITVEDHVHEQLFECSLILFDMQMLFCDAWIFKKLMYNNSVLF